MQIVDAIEHIAGPLSGVLVGFILSHLSLSARRRRLLRKELGYLKAAVRHTTVRNYLPVRLSELREFLLRNPQLLDKKSNYAFFMKWLDDPVVESGESVNDLSWDSRRTEEMLNGLQEVKA